MSKKITLGKVAITPKGRWSAEIEYEKLDAVLHDGSLWIARRANVGQLPSEESEYWKIAAEGVASSPGAETSVVAFLPDRLCVATGSTLEIYNRQVCPDADKYHFKWTCAIGRAFDRKFSVTATFAQRGTYPLDLEIVNDNGDIVWSKSVSLYVGNPSFEGTLVICPIGSTYTDSKEWLSEIEINLSEWYIHFAGSIDFVDGISHEGRSGWTSTTYLTKAEEYNTYTEAMMENPFWNGERFSWQHYIDTYNAWSDAIQLFFGEDELLDTDDDTLINNIMQMIGTIRSEVGNIPIFVAPPPCPGTQNGMAKMVSSEYRDFNGKCKYEIDKMFIRTSKKIYEAIIDSGYSNVFFIPMTQCFDSENNFPTTMEKVNPRSSTTERIQSDARRPTEEGYKQMADIIYGAYSGAWG